MTKKLLLFTASCAFFSVVLSSYEGGAAKDGAGDATGRINASFACARSGCHSGGGMGTTSASIEVRLKDLGATSTPVTGFIDGQTYLVTIKGSNTNYTKYGFQLLAVEGDEKGTTKSGTFSNLPTDTHIKTLAGIDIVEQSAVLSGTGNDYETTVEWTAPNPGPTMVSFAGVINAVNGTGSESGDMPSSTVSSTLQNTTSVKGITNRININAYPNPVVGNYLHLDMQNVMQGTYSIHVYGINGALMYQNEIDVNSNNATTAINTERWAAGNYIVHINRGDDQKMITVVKQ